jgi:hypothetical protein
VSFEEQLRDGEVFGQAGNSRQAHNGQELAPELKSEGENMQHVSSSFRVGHAEDAHIIM